MMCTLGVWSVQGLMMRDGGTVIREVYIVCGEFTGC